THTHWLDSLEQTGFLLNIYVKRDKVLAHTDRKFVIEIESEFIKDNPPLEPGEIREAYISINQLLSDIEKYFFGKPARIGFVDTESEIKNEVSEIMKRKL
ncbi:MAG: hypothetical protein MUO77_21425, partial [Anaerolineales bacterium]|nr:hypothetical protein [Anaerolineales bacterium]